jgi:hypothetical protein
MIIPRKYQIFPEPVVLLDVDAERFSLYLSSWMHLHTLLTLGVNDKDLQRLIVLELCGKQRRHILHRLLMRLGRMQRYQLQQKIERLLT